VCGGEYEAEGEPIVEAGQKTVVLDGNGELLCIIDTMGVRSWLTRTWTNSSRPMRGRHHPGSPARSALEFLLTLSKIGKDPALDIPLLCERLRIVHI